jgi:hypothetical protein
MSWGAFVALSPHDLFGAISQDLTKRPPHRYNLGRSKSMFQVLLPAEFREPQWHIVLDFLQRGHEFRRNEWRQVIIALDLLKNAAVLTDHGLQPFPVIYRQYVEDRYASSYIEQLYRGDQTEARQMRQWAAVARAIEPNLVEIGLSRPDVPATRLLVAYCLYWWKSFALGYALEIEIQKDLVASGIQFEMHDLRLRETRLSPYDLVVLGFKGDIKTSTYFLQAARTRSLLHDFYITRVRGRERTRTLVVFVKPEMWHTIDGETLLVLLEKIADTLPQAMRIVYRGNELTVVDYETWKTKVRLCQEHQLTSLLYESPSDESEAGNGTPSP